MPLALTLMPAVPVDGSDGAPASSQSPSKKVTIGVEGGAFLEAEEWLPAANGAPAAGVLLIHSFARSRGEWGSFPAVLAGAGYRALAVDLRGHGGSSPVTGSRERILDDPELAPRDLTAALAWLRAAPGADPSRMAVIGGALGADLACVADGKGLVRTAVAISPDRDRVHRLEGTGKLHLQSVFYLASSGDPGAEPSARRLALETRGSKQVRVFTGASEHGEAVLAAHPEAVTLILEWLHRAL